MLSISFVMSASISTSPVTTPPASMRIGLDLAQAHTHSVQEAIATLEHEQAAVRQAGRVGDAVVADAGEREGLGLLAAAVPQPAEMFLVAAQRMLGQRQDRALEGTAAQHRHGLEAVGLHALGLGRASPEMTAAGRFRPCRWRSGRCDRSARMRSAASPWSRSPLTSTTPSESRSRSLRKRLAVAGLERADAGVIEAGETIVPRKRCPPSSRCRSRKWPAASCRLDRARGPTSRRSSTTATSARRRRAIRACRISYADEAIFSNEPILVATTCTSSTARPDVSGFRRANAAPERSATPRATTAIFFRETWHEGTPICVEIRRSRIQRAACAACRREGRPRFPAEASSLACSSNNSTSLSVMAPASSLGSVMVTARE